MVEQFVLHFRTGCGNSAKFVRFFDMGFIGSIVIWSNQWFNIHKLFEHSICLHQQKINFVT